MFAKAPVLDRTLMTALLLPNVTYAPTNGRQEYCNGFRGGMAKLGQATTVGLKGSKAMTFLTSSFIDTIWQHPPLSSSQHTWLQLPQCHEQMPVELGWKLLPGFWSRTTGSAMTTNSPLGTASPVICFLHWRCTVSSWGSTRCDPGLFSINSLFCACLSSFKFVKCYAKMTQHMLLTSNSTSTGPFFQGNNKGKRLILALFQSLQTQE